ncbi:MAG: hypothetical protein IT425_10495 [Pirellulales bacterium]|nr:hypothetical protein [Pirellulales bacterium]
MRLTYCILTLGMACLCASRATASMISIAMDLDTTRTSSSNTGGTISTQPGFVSWNVTTLGTSGTTKTEQGVTFELFGFAGSNQSRLRSAGDGGVYNAITTDFVYNEGGSNRAIGLRITGLPVGNYDMQSWHYDSSFPPATNDDFIQIEVRNQGEASDPPNQTVVDAFEFSGLPASFVVPVTAAGQVKEIIFREDSATNRARLNGFTLTTGVPEVSASVLLAVYGVIMVGRRFRASASL